MRSLSKIDIQSNLVVGLIPARWSSSRFEGKPLAEINGVPMIRRVYEQACKAETLDTVVVLTDDHRISTYCSKNEMRCIVVDSPCRTGTDRCAKVLDLVDGKIFVNIQGDEPIIDPENIDAVVNAIEEDKNICVTNAYTLISDDYKCFDPNVVKVVVDTEDFALYYSRKYIGEKQQLGLYAFTRDMLKEFPNLPVGDNEINEQVEMLRYVENQYGVKMVHVADAGLSVDTPEDLKMVEKYLDGLHVRQH